MHKKFSYLGLCMVTNIPVFVIIMMYILFIDCYHRSQPNNFSTLLY